MSTLSAVYPFATQNGQAIPLDILRPSALAVIDFTAEANTAFTIPEDYSVAILIATASCIVRFGGLIPIPVVGSVIYEDTLIVPAGQAVATSLVPGGCSILGTSEGGQLYFQFIEKWAGLALDRQYTRK